MGSVEVALSWCPLLKYHIFFYVFLCKHAMSIFEYLNARSGYFNIDITVQYNNIYIKVSVVKI